MQENKNCKKKKETPDYLKETGERIEKAFKVPRASSEPSLLKNNGKKKKKETLCTNIEKISNIQLKNTSYNKIKNIDNRNQQSKRFYPHTSGIFTRRDLDDRNLLYLDPLNNSDLPLPKIKQKIDITQSIEKSLVINFQFPQEQLDYETINWHVLCETVEFYLFNTLTNDEILNQWLPGERQNVVWRTSNGAEVNTTKTYGEIFLFQSEHPIVEQYKKSDNQHVESSKFALISLFVGINNLDFDIAVNTLAKKFNIDIKNCFVVEKAKQNIIKKSYMESLFCKDTKVEEGIVFYDENNVNILTLVNAFGLLLPCSNWIRPSDYKHSTFNIMPDGKVPLLNLNYIKKYSHYPVLLTPRLHLANNEKNVFLGGDMLVTSWYGRKYTIKNIDFTPLEGRRLFYICEENDNYIKNIKDFLLILKQLEKYPKVKIKVILTKTGEEYKILSKYNFLELAQSQNVYIHKSLKKYLTAVVNPYPKAIKERPFIIEPIINENDLVVLFAPSGLGKTWLSLSMAIAIANGKDVCDTWHVTDSKRVMYISGEMSRSALENRIYKLNKTYSPDESIKNFIPIRPDEVIDITKEEGQAVIERYFNTYLDKIEVLVIDNLIAFSSGGTTEGGWSKIYKWLKDKFQNVTIIIIHHTNKDKNYRGSSDIKNKSDFMISGEEYGDLIKSIEKEFKGLKPKEKPSYSLIESVLAELYGKVDKGHITMYIDYEKYRDISQESVTKFRASLSIQDEIPQWHIKNIDMDKIVCKIYEYLNIESDFSETEFTYPSIPITRWDPELQRERIIELYQEGLTTKEMAERLNVSKSSIDSIRENTATRKRDLKNEGITPYSMAMKIILGKKV